MKPSYENETTTHAMKPNLACRFLGDMNPNLRSRGCCGTAETATTGKGAARVHEGAKTFFILDSETKGARNKNEGSCLRFFFGLES